MGNAKGTLVRGGTRSMVQLCRQRQQKCGIPVALLFMQLTLLREMIVNICKIKNNGPLMGH